MSYFYTENIIYVSPLIIFAFQKNNVLANSYLYKFCARRGIKFNKGNRDSFTCTVFGYI